MATTFTVIGLGAFGRAAALMLQSLGNTVIGLDTDPKMVEVLEDKIPHALIADGSSKATLEEINVAQSQGVLVSIGENLEASLLCVLHLKQLGVTNIWVKAKSDAHHAILSDMGVLHVIHPEKSMGKRVAQKMHFPLMQDMLTIAPGYILMVLDMPAREEPMTVGDILSSHDDIHLCALYRNQQFYQEEIGDQTPLCTGDRLVFGGPQSSLRPLLKEIRAR